MAFRDLFRRGGRDDSSRSARNQSGQVDPAALIEQVHQLRRLGRLEDARQQVASALASGPGLGDHADLNRLYWDLCVQLERPQDAQRQMLRAITGQLRDGRAEDAAFGWFELCDRLDEAPTIDLDLRRRLAEAMLSAGHGEAASELLEKVQPDATTPLAISLRLALVAAKSRAPSAEALVAAVLARPGVPESQRQTLTAALEAARAQGFHTASDQVQDAGPIELAATSMEGRSLKVAAAVPRAVDGERLTLGFPNGQQRGIALSQVQALAAARIDEGVGHSYVLIDLFLDSLWSDAQELRVVRLRTRDFSALSLVPGAADEQLALGTLLANLLASSGAHALPDAEAACGRPFHAFASVAEYQQRVLEIG